MRIDIVTVLPELLESPFGHSIVKRAIEKGVVEVNLHQLRNYTPYKHGQIDDYPFGGGAGMVLMVEPLVNCIESLQKERKYDDIIFLTPDGVTYTQKIANQLSTYQNIMLICGHYKGIDDRVRQHFVTREISIGDYVLSGGELAAAIVCDSIVRLIPGSIGDETSALTDSFQDNLLAPPVFSRPAEFRGWGVPDVLLSGHQLKIEEWRHNQAIDRTQQRRPDLLDY